MKFQFFKYIQLLVNVGSCILENQHINQKYVKEKM